MYPYNHCDLKKTKKVYSIWDTVLPGVKSLKRCIDELQCVLVKVFSHLRFFQGALCMSDVNECERYAGKPNSCQNGATCVNLPGSYR